MTFPWTSQYPPLVPATIDVAPARSLVDLIGQALTHHRGRPALTSVGRTTSYAELDLMSRRFAAWLKSQGFGKSDRIAIMMPNLTPFAVAVLGALRAGGVVVTVNPLYTPRELAHQLRDSGAKILVVFEGFAATAAAALEDATLREQVSTQVLIGTGMADAPPAQLPRAIAFLQCLQHGALIGFESIALSCDDLAFLQYTGGTTGVSKGAMLTHGNIMANIAQMSAWMTPAMRPDDAPGRNIVSFLPLYHIFALTFCLFYGLHNGMHNLLVANPRDLPGAVQELGGLPIHVFPGVNTLFAGLVAHPNLLAGLNLRELRLAVGGGTAVQRGVAERWLAATGVPICEGYGLSETSPVASCNVVTNRAWTGTIGLPVPNTEISIRDDGGAPVPAGERGEICIRGPQVMAGYWNRPEETANVMTEDGFFRSGDIGIMDDRGSVRIVDRKKDMILVSGFNVFPNEVEDVVSQIPGVLESAAVGVPDERSGEAVRLFVVRSDPTLTVDAIARHCRENLTAYKCPRLIEFRDALPKSTVGKILRRELRV